jgi:hypothetical protein
MTQTFDSSAKPHQFDATRTGVLRRHAGGAWSRVRTLSRSLAVLFAAAVVGGTLLPPTPAMAASRSVHIVLVNNTPFNLYRERGHLDHGVWASHTPEVIGDYGEWASESNGFLTGTEGWATYRIIDFDNHLVGKVTVRWDNPYAGSNSYSESVTPNGWTHSDGYSIGHFGGGGNNARVTFRLEPGACQFDSDTGETACTSS